MITTNFNIEIDNIEVDKEFFSFDYKVFRDGELILVSEYSSDHSWDCEEEFKEVIESNYGIELVLEQLIEAL